MSRTNRAPEQRLVPQKLRARIIRRRVVALVQPHRDAPPHHRPCQVPIHDSQAVIRFERSFEH